MFLKISLHPFISSSVIFSMLHLLSACADKAVRMKHSLMYISVIKGPIGGHYNKVGPFSCFIKPAIGPSSEEGSSSISVRTE